MLTLLQRAQEAKLPRAKEWLWEIDNLNDRVLRTACFHEYARETRSIVEAVRRIDELCNDLNLAAADCFAIQSGGILQESGLLRRNAKLGSELLARLRALTRAFAPLEPHVLIGRRLEQTPFFSLPSRFTGDIDLLFEETVIRKRPRIHGKFLCWFVKVEEILQTFIRVSDRTPRPINENENPPNEMFEGPNGRRLNETTATMLILPRRHFELQPAVLISKLAIQGRSEQTREFERETLRIECGLTAGVLEVDTLAQIDETFVYDGKEELYAVVTHKSAIERNVACAIDIVTQKRIREEDGSILSAKRVIYPRKDGRGPSKPNREFYESALAAISAVRLGHTLSAEDFERLKQLMDNLGYKPRVPHTSVSHIKESLARYREYAKMIFPSLTDEEREPSSIYNPNETRRHWTIERSKKQLSIRRSNYKDPEPPADTKTPPLS